MAPPSPRPRRGSPANPAPARRRRRDREDPPRLSPGPSCTTLPPCEEEQHVGSSASAQALVPDGLQQIAFHDLTCKEEHVGEPASAQTLQEPDVAPLKELLDTTLLEESSITATSSSSLQDTIKVSPPSGRCLSSSTLWMWQLDGWGITFYTREDLGGSFDTYPRVGGPFQSLDEAYSAIDRYLHDLRDPTMGTEISRVDSAVRKALYYPDGARRLRSRPVDERRDWMRQLVQALVDQYNDFHKLSRDLAHELKNVVCHNGVLEGRDYELYYHINFTTKTKGADGFNTGSDNLFFAEVRYKPVLRGELVVSCCCMVKPCDDGCCYACQNGMKLKHPNGADAYVAGRVKDAYKDPFSGTRLGWKEADDDLKAQEARLRLMFKSLDDPDYDEKMRAYMAPSLPWHTKEDVAGAED